jgi:hypothetical protein
MTKDFFDGLEEFGYNNCVICGYDCINGVFPEKDFACPRVIRIDKREALARVRELISEMDKVFYSVPQPTFLIEKWERAKDLIEIDEEHKGGEKK